MFTKELLESKDCLIIYHKEDNDGLLSAAILGNAIANAKNLGGEPGTYSGVSYYGTNYSELSAWVKAKANGEKDSPLDDILESFDALVITDISFNEPDAMLALKLRYDKAFLWIDHHAPAIERANEIGYWDVEGVRKSTCSAIMCAWEYCYGNKPAPGVFVKLSDYDSWTYPRKKDIYPTQEDIDDLFALNIGITEASRLDIDWFDNFVQSITSDNKEVVKSTVMLVEQCRAYGKVILANTRKRAGEMIENHGDCTWTFAGEDACMVITTDRVNSDSFASLKDDPRIEHGVVFKRHKDGHWTLHAYNIRESCETHCGKYLEEHYGGGGHKGAAGCTLTEEKVIELLKSKTI